MAKSNNIEKLSGYELMRRWFDFAFENQDKVCPTHTAMFAWFVELNNRMGWTDKFASPASQTMSAISLKSYNTYKKIFDDLVKFGFVTVISESKNQWSACIIALSNNNNTHYNALYNALLAQCTTQSESSIQSTSESTYSINKPINLKPINLKQEEVKEEILSPQLDLTLNKKIMEWFGFTETANYDKMRRIGEFQRCLVAQERLEYFEIQFPAYMEFKNLDPRYKHSFDKFIGSPEFLYVDGQWNAENWIEKLKTEKTKTNGKSDQTNYGRRSNQSPVTTAGYSKL